MTGFSRVDRARLPVIDCCDRTGVDAPDAAPPTVVWRASPGAVALVVAEGVATGVGIPVPRAGGAVAADGTGRGGSA